MMTTSIQFKQVSKKFTLNQSRPQSWQEILLRLFKRPQRAELEKRNFWVLKDISFEVNQGETFSLIGSNGVGKSTLLKLMTHIIKPTQGTICINGRVAALLELGTGFHPDLTGRENIFLGGSLAGLARQEVNQNLGRIIEFADIGQFIDVPVRHYSSGMFVRLGFALAIHLNPDILVVDEVLAVGDQSFQAKCLAKIQGVRNQGKTVLFVSHNMNMIRSISDRVMWIKGGAVERIGSPDDVIQAYLTEEKTINVGPNSQRNHMLRDKIAVIESVVLINDAGEPVLTLETGKKATIRINYLTHERVEKPVFGLSIHGKNLFQINGPSTNTSNFAIDYIDGKGAVEYQIDFLPLLTGTYSVTAGLFDQTTTVTYDYCDHTYSFTVEQGPIKEMYGMVYMPANWRHIPER